MHALRLICRSSSIRISAGSAYPLVQSSICSTYANTHGLYVPRNSRAFVPPPKEYMFVPHRAPADRQGGSEGENVCTVGGGPQGGTGSAVPMKRRPYTDQVTVGMRPQHTALILLYSSGLQVSLFQSGIDMHLVDEPALRRA